MQAHHKLEESDRKRAFPMEAAPASRKKERTQAKQKKSYDEMKEELYAGKR